jgi:hypothetical protein
MKKISHKSYNTDTIQQTAGFPDPTEQSMSAIFNEVEAASVAYWREKRLARPPSNSHYNIAPIEQEHRNPEQSEAALAPV